MEAMPIDVKPFLEDAARCAVVIFECQDSVIGEGGPYPGLVESVRESGMIGNVAKLLACARKAGAGVFYCTFSRRPGGLGAAELPRSMGRVRVPSTEPTPRGMAPDVVKEIAPETADVVVDRHHGLSAFHDTGLDPILRQRETRTVIPVGVSLNIGILGTTIEAVNRGYSVVLPTDCVAADPPEYAEQVLRYTFRNLALLTTGPQIADAWGVA